MLTSGRCFLSVSKQTTPATLQQRILLLQQPSEPHSSQAPMPLLSTEPHSSQVPTPLLSTVPRLSSANPIAVNHRLKSQCPPLSMTLCPANSCFQPQLVVIRFQWCPWPEVESITGIGRWWATPPCCCWRAVARRWWCRRWNGWWCWRCWLHLCSCQRSRRQHAQHQKQHHRTHLSLWTKVLSD